MEKVARGQRQDQVGNRQQAVGQLGEPGERARAFAGVAQQAADPRPSCQAARLSAAMKSSAEAKPRAFSGSNPKSATSIRRGSCGG
jgi:hypothetical protein